MKTNDASDNYQELSDEIDRIYEHVTRVIEIIDISSLPENHYDEIFAKYDHLLGLKKILLEHGEKEPDPLIRSKTIEIGKKTELLCDQARRYLNKILEYQINAGMEL